MGLQIPGYKVRIPNPDQPGVPANLYKTDYALSFGRASLTIYNDFSGKIYPTGFYDTWDLDPKPWGVRSYPAEIITRYYNWSLKGTNFRVTYP